MNCSELTSFLDSQLAIGDISDVSNNGVQCDGASQLLGAGFAVDACEATIRAAIDAECNFLFCHHGLSWGGGIARLTGYTRRRFALLIAHQVTLYAAHLPLDRHPEFGNNAVLCDLLGIPAASRLPFGLYHGNAIGFRGMIPAPMALGELSALLDRELATQCRCWDNRAGQPIRQIAVVSGGGADAIEEAADAGCDCLLTGEFSQQYYHPARDLGIDVIAAGHYATEATGPKAVMELVRRHFPHLHCVFLDYPTGL